jgi:hypothetical protein
MKIQYLLIILCLVFALASCAGNPRDLIVGKWQKVDGSDMIEFYQNGTLNIKGTAGLFKKSGTGTYKFIDDGRVKLEMGGSGIEVKITVSKEELTLTDPEGTVLKYRSVKWFAFIQDKGISPFILPRA